MFSSNQNETSYLISNKNGIAYSCENVEEERLDVVVEGLRVEEELDEEAQVLAVNLVQVPVNLKHRQVVLKTLIRFLSLGKRKCN